MGQAPRRRQPLLPEHVYGPAVEPFTGIAFALSRTRHLKAGSGISVLPRRHPVLVAFKKAGELLSDYLADATGVEILSYRISPWGPGGNPSPSFSALPQLVHAAARGTAPDFSALSSPAYVDDGLDVCYVKDCARAIALLQLAPRLNHRTYNIASGKVLTNREAAAAIKGSSPTRGPSAQSPTTLPGSVKATTANRSPPTWGQRRRRPRNPADKAAAP